MHGKPHGGTMTEISYTELRRNLARYLDETTASREPIVVTRQGKEPLVFMPLQEFEGWQETVHLLSSPLNAEHLLESIRQAEAGQLHEHELIPAEKEQSKV
jgi:antitoxin YefM